MNNGYENRQAQIETLKSQKFELVKEQTMQQLQERLAMLEQEYRNIDTMCQEEIANNAPNKEGYRQILEAEMNRIKSQIAYYSGMSNQNIINENMERIAEWRR